MSRKLNGDTLIEVLFAFAILSTVIGTAFSGAMASYKSAVVAQQRTQAQLLAQYQADGLLTYRNSLAWDSASNLPNFLDGGSGLLAVSTLERFCMRADSKPSDANAPYSWNILSVSKQCSDLASSQAPNLINPAIYITPDGVNNSQNKKGYTITVAWRAANASSTNTCDPATGTNQCETATRSVILTDK